MAPHLVQAELRGTASSRLGWLVSGCSEVVSHPRTPLGLLGTPGDMQLVESGWDESTEHLRKGMANVISPSVPPPS